MTRKDFQLIADAIASAERYTMDVDVDGIGLSTLRLIVDQLSAVIQHEHPRFDAGRFEKAALPLQSERRKQAIQRALDAGVVDGQARGGDWYDRWGYRGGPG